MSVQRAWDPDPLRIGDRVRVRLSGECRAWIHDGSSPRVNGALAIVREIWHGQEDEADLPGHTYRVGFLERIPNPLPGHPTARIVSSTFARAELERLSWESAS